MGGIDCGALDRSACLSGFSDVEKIERTARVAAPPAGDVTCCYRSWNVSHVERQIFESKCVTGIIPS